MSYTKSFLIEAQNAYDEYRNDFDPTPLYNGEDYLTPMSFDDFAETLWCKQNLQPTESDSDDGDYMSYSSIDVI